MAPSEVLVAVVVAILAVLALIALRFPAGRREWPMDARQTAWLIGSGLTAAAMVVLLYLATKDIRWPAATVTLAAVAGLGLALLAGVALFLPSGLRARP